MGTVLGAFLSRGGLNVELIDSYEKHVKALNEQGAKIIGYEKFTAPVKAILPNQMTGIYENGTIPNSFSNIEMFRKEFVAP